MALLKNNKVVANVLSNFIMCNNFDYIMEFKKKKIICIIFFFKYSFRLSNFGFRIQVDRSK